MKTSLRANAVKPSATVTINAKAMQLKAQGIDIINLSVANPILIRLILLKKQRLMPLMRAIRNIQPLTASLP